MNGRLPELVKLLRQGTGFVSGEDMALRTGISRAAVWKHMDKLRKHGFKIESSTRKGYQLFSVPDIPSEEVLAAILTTRFFGSAVEYHTLVGSTNQRAMKLGEEGAVEGTVVTADSQTAGRAKNGNEWESPAGRNLYMSVVLRPNVSVDRVFDVERMAIEALAETVASFCPELPLELVKNGLFSEAGKLGGVLCEVQGDIGRISHLVAGVGLYVSRGPSRAPGLSLEAVSGKKLSRAELTAVMLEKFEAKYMKWKRREQTGSS